MTDTAAMHLIYDQYYWSKVEVRSDTKEDIVSYQQNGFLRNAVTQVVDTNIKEGDIFSFGLRYKQPNTLQGFANDKWGPDTKQGTIKQDYKFKIWSRSHVLLSFHMSTEEAETFYEPLFKQDTGGTDLLQLVADNARAATVVAKVPQGKPAPDIQHLALRAARRRAERQALKRAQPELWTVFRKVDAVCRRHANRRRNQGWVGVCVVIDRSRDGTRAWRLLKCLLMVPRAFNQVLSLAVHLTIQAADLAEQLADQFAARDIAQLPAVPPPAALQCPASCHHPGWIAVQPGYLGSDLADQPPGSTMEAWLSLEDVNAEVQKLRLVRENHILQVIGRPVKKGLSKREFFRLRLIEKYLPLRNTPMLQTCSKKPLSHQFCAYVEAHRISDMISCHKTVRTCKSNEGGVLFFGYFADKICCCIAYAPLVSERLHDSVNGGLRYTERFCNV
ncbi:hypothetical protein MTO96_002244 [Rhipicephalus appendiculatus]